MRTYIARRKNLVGEVEYLQPDDTFSSKENAKETAKEHRITFWITLLSIALELLKMFGTGVKLVKK